MKKSGKEKSLPNDKTIRITLTKDKAYAEDMFAILNAQDHYCPYKLHDKDNKCMCKEFIEQETTGWCTGNLYYKEII